MKFEKATIWGWPDRRPETAYRELLLTACFVLFSFVMPAIFAFVLHTGWAGFGIYFLLTLNGHFLTVGLIQVVVRPFYRRFNADIGPDDPWLLPTANDRAQR